MRGDSLRFDGAAIAAILVLLSGCSTTPPVRFYRLVEAAGAAPVSSERVGFVAVDRVTLPGYLDRPHFVTHTGGTGVRLAEFDRWAEPLQENVARVLVRNLTALLPAAQVSAGSAAADATVDRRVAVHIERFECGPGERCVLEARWRVSETRAGRGPGWRISRHARTAAGASYESRAAAMSHLLADLARAVAERISAAGPS